MKVDARGAACKQPDSDEGYVGVHCSCVRRRPTREGKGRAELLREKQDGEREEEYVAGDVMTLAQSGHCAPFLGQDERGGGREEGGVRGR